MKWINKFINSQIKFYIYKLNQGDCILYNSQNHKNQSIIILHGTLCILYMMKNKKLNSLAIIRDNHLINLKANYIIKNYKLIAFETTYLISFSLKNKINKYNNEILYEIIQAQKMTLKKYEIMSLILQHKYIKYKVINLLLFLALEFGIVDKKKIIIPFIIPQKYLAIIIGVNIITINKFIKLLYKNKIIYNSSKKIIHVINIKKLNLILSY